MTAPRQLDLVELAGGPMLTPQQRADMTRKTPRPKGHIAPPGSGPNGETCKSCEHYTIAHRGNGTFRKCGLNEANWTKGPGSDIRASDPACRLWAAEKKP
jgi:hypothetical protein